MLQIKIDSDTYNITKSKHKTVSNYNVFIHIYKNSEKNPITGFMIKTSDSKDNYFILKHCISSIKGYEKQESLFDAIRVY